MSRDEVKKAERREWIIRKHRTLDALGLTEDELHERVINGEPTNEELNVWRDVVERTNRWLHWTTSDDAPASVRIVRLGST